MKKILKASAIFFIAALFVGTSAAAMVDTPNQAVVASMSKKLTTYNPLRDQVELKYYDPAGLSTVIGIQGGTPPYIWKSAIRLTQAELATYATWTMKQVNVAYDADDGVTGPMHIKIYIYDTGTATHPGSIIVSDTQTYLDTTGITTVNLTTPVDLMGHQELWVAIEWTQEDQGPGCYYAWLDTGSGPAVDGKGDWIFLNSAWSEIQTSGASYDGNWGIGAIVEGAGLATLGIGNFKGPIGVKADITETGGVVDAINLTYSMHVTGGILSLINKTVPGSMASLPAGTATSVSSGMLVGFGKLSIVVTAKADNAIPVTAEKSATLLFFLVVGIK